MQFSLNMLKYSTIYYFRYGIREVQRPIFADGISQCGTEWTHLVIVFRGFNEGEGLSLYTNGRLQSNATNLFQVPMNVQEFSTKLSLGSHHSNGELPSMPASIDEIAMWNKMLTQQEIKELYDSYTSSPREV